MLILHETVVSSLIAKAELSLKFMNGLLDRITKCDFDPEIAEMTRTFKEKRAVDNRAVDVITVPDLNTFDKERGLNIIYADDALEDNVLIVRDAIRFAPLRERVRSINNMERSVALEHNRLLEAIRHFHQLVETDKQVAGDSRLGIYGVPPELAKYITELDLEVYDEVFNGWVEQLQTKEDSPI